MDLVKYALIFVAGITVAYLAFRLGNAFRLYLRFRGKRLVACPETNQPAAVDVAARQVAMRAVFGRPQLRLSDCSRWPERQDCGQDCLQQIEASPEGCLVWNIVDRWYKGQSCAYCHKPFGHIQWLDHRPALLSPERKTVQWCDVSAEKLPEVFATHLPVCWDCHIAETFRHEHPELVVDRPSRHVQ